MNKDYDNNMRGVLFPNDRKEKDTQPDLKGNCEIGGVEYWLSAWRKEGAKGRFLSLAFTKKEARQQRPPEPKPEPKDEHDNSDDVPF
jgi:hypothetical protein